MRLHAQPDAALPHLIKHGAATQLIVEGKPYLMRGGEFSNKVYETPDDLPHLGAMLEAYRGAGINTLLVPISWRSLEPREGAFDYRMIDTLGLQAEKPHVRTFSLQRVGRRSTSDDAGRSEGLDLSDREAPGLDHYRVKFAKR